MATSTRTKPKDDVVDDCGCGGREIDTNCHSPKPVPWLEGELCQVFYETRVFELGRLGDLVGIRDREGLAVRVSFEHRLCLIGRQQGPLLYTTTLLPGESQTIYEFDRYRRVRSQTEQVSVHASFRQTLSALSQSRNSSSSSSYTNTLVKTRAQADSSVSVGGGLVGWLTGAPEGGVSSSVSTEAGVAAGSSASRASEEFTQNARTASQAVEAERSLVISSFEDSEHQQATQRTLSNANRCYAVTYFVRRVMEVYEASTRVISLEWSVAGSPPRDIDDLEGLPDQVVEILKRVREALPKVGDEAKGGRRITLPTDGALYEPELAYCSSCEPLTAAEHEIGVRVAGLGAERARLENQLITLEIERRQGLAASGTPVELEIGTVTISPEPEPETP